MRFPRDRAGTAPGNGRSEAFLRDWCRRRDGGPYPAYRELRGVVRLPVCELEILRVQPDPFAGPSRIRLRIPFESTSIDPVWGTLAGGWGTRRPGLVDPESARAVGARDYLGRWIGSWLENRDAGQSDRAPVAIDRHGQAVLDRSAVILHPDGLEVRLHIDLPARGRRILGRVAEELLLQLPVRLVREGLGSVRNADLERHADTVEDFAILQQSLPEQGWVAFIADGSRLARRAGHDDRPMQQEPIVPFESPPELRRSVRLPHGGEISGMAIPPGVTLLCGGGFHGKSTLLRALGAAVVPHVPGDGRERAATRVDVQAIRAEDGRAVTSVDLRPFLHDLPFGKPTNDFSTENASGSTSQAAAILEAIQGGSRLLLIDEDTSATNFMIRDPLMERLLQAHQEPITPFLHRARTLHDRLGVSSLLVIGGSGEYFRVADRVLLLDTYRPLDRTEAARAIARQRPSIPAEETAVGLLRTAVDPARRLPRGPTGSVSRGARVPRGPRVRALGPRRLLVERLPLELIGLEALRDSSQARFLARVLEWRFREQLRGSQGRTEADGSVRDLERAYLAEWGRGCLDGFDREVRGDLAAVRFMDLLAAVNRLRATPAPGVDWALDSGVAESGGKTQ